MLKKKTKAGGIKILDFSIYYIKTVWYWHKNTHRHWNRTENLELDPEMYSQLIFDKTGKGIHWKKKTVSLANGGARTGQQHAEE